MWTCQITSDKKAADKVQAVQAQINLKPTMWNNVESINWYEYYIDNSDQNTQQLEYRLTERHKDQKSQWAKCISNHHELHSAIFVACSSVCSNCTHVSYHHHEICSAHVALFSKTTEISLHGRCAGWKDFAFQLEQLSFAFCLRTTKSFTYSGQYLLFSL